MAGVSLDSEEADSLPSLTGESTPGLVDVADAPLALAGLGVDCSERIWFWLLMGLIMMSPEQFVGITVLFTE